MPSFIEEYKSKDAANFLEWRAAYCGRRRARFRLPGDEIGKITRQLSIEMLRAVWRRAQQSRLRHAL